MVAGFFINVAFLVLKGYISMPRDVYSSSVLRGGTTTKGDSTLWPADDLFLHRILAMETAVLSLTAQNKMVIVNEFFTMKEQVVALQVCNNSWISTNKVLVSRGFEEQLFYIRQQSNSNSMTKRLDQALSSSQMWQHQLEETLDRKLTHQMQSLKQDPSLVNDLIWTHIHKHKDIYPWTSGVFRLINIPSSLTCIVGINSPHFLYFIFHV